MGFKKSSGQTEMEAMSLLMHGLSLREKKDFPSALEKFEASLKVSRKIRHKLLIARNLMQIGEISTTIIKSRGQFDFKRGTACLEEALKIMRELNDLQGIAICLTDLASIIIHQIHRKRFSPDRLINPALSYAQEANEIFRKIPDLEKNPPLMKFKATNLTSLAFLNFQLDKDQAALDYLEEALPIAQRINDVELVNGIKIQIKTVSQSLNRFR